MLSPIAGSQPDSDAKAEKARMWATKYYQNHREDINRERRWKRRFLNRYYCVDCEIFFYGSGSWKRADKHARANGLHVIFQHGRRVTWK